MQAIVAVSQSWGIGKDGRLLFRLSADLRRFKALTTGRTVVMGRKTLQSLPGGKGLPNRRNLVAAVFLLSVSRTEIAWLYKTLQIIV